MRPARDLVTLTMAKQPVKLDQQLQMSQMARLLQEYLANVQMELYLQEKQLRIKTLDQALQKRKTEKIDFYLILATKKKRLLNY